MYKRTALFASVFTASALLSTGALAQSNLPEFGQLDKDGDGVISMQEAEGTPLGQNFQQADSDGDGNIGGSEYGQFQQQQQQSSMPDFSELDKDGNGALIESEVKGTPLEQDFQQVDHDNDDSMTKQEYQQYKQQQQQGG